MNFYSKNRLYIYIDENEMNLIKNEMKYFLTKALDIAELFFK